MSNNGTRTNEATLDEIGVALAQAARELSLANRARLTDALWAALSTPVGGLDTQARRK